MQNIKSPCANDGSLNIKQRIILITNLGKK